MTASTPEAREQARADRRVERAAQTPADRCSNIVKGIAEVTGEAWTFGYIGNCDVGFDDRAWSAFRPHPGRMGTAEDRIGSHATEDLDKLALILQGALAAFRMTARAAR